MDRQRPGTGEDDWRRKAKCLDENPELFYPVAGEGTPIGDEQRAEAKAVCYQCPVREECLEEAFVASNDFGVWGGMTEKERTLEKRKRTRRTRRRLGTAALNESATAHPVTSKIRVQDRPVDILSVPGLEV